LCVRNARRVAVLADARAQGERRAGESPRFDMPVRVLSSDGKVRRLIG